MCRLTTAAKDPVLGFYDAFSSPLHGCRYGPPQVWTRNNAAGVWDCQVELPHSLAAAQAAAGAAETAPDAPASDGKPSKRPPLHPGAAAGPAPAAAAAPPAAPAAKGLPRLRSVPAIPVHEDVEKQQPGVTAQADDARLLNSPVAQVAAEVGVGAAGAPAAAAAAADSNSWRQLLEEELRWAPAACAVCFHCVCKRPLAPAVCRRCSRPSVPLARLAWPQHAPLPQPVLPGASIVELCCWLAAQPVRSCPVSPCVLSPPPPPPPGLF